MEPGKIKYAILILIVCSMVGGMLTLFFQRFISFSAPTRPVAGPAPATPGGKATYNPPSPQDAPPELREAVLLGFNLMNDTGKYAAAHVGNSLRCSNCHLKAGLTMGGKNGGISLVGVGATYPQYPKRQVFSVHLVTRTNDCFKRSMNGRSLAEDSREMAGLVTYYQWISRGIPVYGVVPWLGLKKINNPHKPDVVAGKELYATKCVACHGRNGEGTNAAPPMWGEKSFNDGAGMVQADTFAAFAHDNMPLGNPDLSEEQSLDVAAFATSQPRPRFKK
jgi:thiosulfate dehydrogenase